MNSSALQDKANDLPVVNRFLLDALATNFGATPPRPPDNLDWDRVLKAVAFHRVPLLLSDIENDAPIPNDARVHLQALRRRAALRALTLTAATVEAMRACQAAGVRALVLKGPMHSVLFFGRPDRRWSRDIDLLVAPDDRSAALQVLGTLGFIITVQSVGVTTVHRQRDNAVIELHTALDVDERLLPLSLLRPFDDARQVMLGGCPVETLSAEKSVVYAAFHGTKHLWRQYFWLCDMAAAQRWGGIDWAEALSIARAVGVDRHLNVACILAETHLGVPSPLHDLVAKAEVDWARRFARDLRPVLSDQDFEGDGAAFRSLGRMRYLWWDIRLQRRLSARWALLVWPWRPSDRDRRFFPLPRGLEIFYPLVRLYRVLIDARARRKQP